MLVISQWFKFCLLYNISTKTEPTPYFKNHPIQVWFATKNHPFFTENDKYWYTKISEGTKKIIPLTDFLETSKKLSYLFDIM